jgi:hypothetical protein
MKMFEKKKLTFEKTIMKVFEVLAKHGAETSKRKDDLLYSMIMKVFVMKVFEVVERRGGGRRRVRKYLI